MRGELLWFNEARGDGLIATSDGGRVAVTAAGFVEGHLPVGRCAGTPVEFELVEANGDQARATSVRVVDDPNPRRARLRGGSGGGRRVGAR
jgi:hypothetical protein